MPPGRNTSKIWGWEAMFPCECAVHITSDCQNTRGMETNRIWVLLVSTEQWIPKTATRTDTHIKPLLHVIITTATISGWGDAPLFLTVGTPLKIVIPPLQGKNLALKNKQTRPWLLSKLVAQPDPEIKSCWLQSPHARIGKNECEFYGKNRTAK